MMEYRFLQSEQVRLISSRARDWLVGLQKRVDNNANCTIRNAFQILVGLWICERALLDDKEFSYTKSQVQNVNQCTASHTDVFTDLLHADPPILMVHYFRIYNLELGMGLLRCMHYLDLCKNRSFYTGLNFLITQQQLEGRFGFLAQEISQLPISREQFEPDLNIYLPHTVSFLWTIAEITNPQFILANSF